MESIHAHFHIKNLQAKVKAIIARCHICKQTKRNVPNYGKVPLVVPYATKPWEVIQVDLFGPWSYMRMLMMESPEQSWVYP